MSLIYKYTATLRDGTIVNGSYLGNGEKQQSVKIKEATLINPVIGITISKPKNLSNSELKVFGNYCFHCNTKLTAITEYGGWVQKFVCTKCAAETEIHQHDAMSGCLIDYTILIKKDGNTNTIDIPFKD